MIMFAMDKCALSRLGHEKLRICSKKSVQQGRRQIQAQSVPFVREHLNLTRTLLADFFNRPVQVNRLATNISRTPPLPQTLVFATEKIRVSLEAMEAR